MTGHSALSATAVRPVVLWLLALIVAGALVGVWAWAWRMVSEARSAAARASEDAVVARLSRRAERQGRHRGDGDPDSGPFAAVGEMHEDAAALLGTQGMETHLRQLQQRQAGPLRQVGKWGGPQ